MYVNGYNLNELWHARYCVCWETTMPQKLGSNADDEVWQFQDEIIKTTNSFANARLKCNLQALSTHMRSSGATITDVLAMPVYSTCPNGSNFTHLHTTPTSYTMIIIIQNLYGAIMPSGDYRSTDIFTHICVSSADVTFANSGFEHWM